MLRKYRRPLAAFLLFTILTNIFLPTVSWALTAGPTAPEATSFEPVDTTDMVNMLTGDLAYNIPLLEVPGPSGGYPLSLSYHAGIMPDEEASWTGLGWTLNPGSIARNVNGFADDHKDMVHESRAYWKGGERRSFEAGVTLGVSGMVGATAGLSISHDTYQGFGVGSFVGVNVGLGGNVGVNATLGVNPFGGAYASAGLGLHVGGAATQGLSATVGVGVATNFSSVSASANGGVSVGYDKPGSKNILKAGGASVMGASISTSKEGSSMSLSAGGASIHNSKSGVVSTSSEGFTLPIPFVSLGYKYQRYWIDQSESAGINGSLYNPKKLPSGFDYNGADSYSLLDPELSMVDNPDPDKVMGGSFLNYDNYYVNAQGIMGNMRPYSYKNLIFRQNRKEGDTYHVKQFPYTKGLQDEPFEFRFIGDFSNKYLNDGGSILHEPLTPLVPSFDSMEKTGENGSNGIVNKRLPGSRNINWYTNAQISGTDQSKNPSDDGFVNCNASGFVRGADYQIGGIMITNESGVNYHFALPAYTYTEYQYSENKDKSGGLKFNELTKDPSYAYTWYLTAVTGPDYVDRGPDGVADGKLNEHDWGYWVEFEYGKWTDIYCWRNPAEGMRPDLDNRFQNFAQGRKELYYLDAIRTRTHTALFFKDIRHDAKGTLYNFKDREVVIYEDILGRATDKQNIVETTKQGGFVPRKVTNSFKHTSTTLFAHEEEDEKEKDEGTTTYYPIPASTLKLSSIYLIDNEKLKSVGLTKERGEEYESVFFMSWDVTSNDLPPNRSINNFKTTAIHNHLYQNVLDIHDLNAINSNLTTSAQRIINFETNYSLIPETSNSFDYKIANNWPRPINDSDYPRFGKLTLAGLKFLGKAGVDQMPPMKFEYDLSAPIQGDASLIIDGNSFYFSHANANLSVGDILKINDSELKYYYASIESVTADAIPTYKLKIIGRNTPSQGRVHFIQTKNPPYNKEYYDIWGMYKSDYEDLGNENLSRLTTEASAKNVEVWSLQKVKTSLGAEIEIEYEPDIYHNALAYKGSLFIKELIPQETHGTIKATFYNNIKFTQPFSPSNPIKVLGLLRYYGVAVDPLKMCIVDREWQRQLWLWDVINQVATVNRTGTDYLVLHSEVLYNQLKKVKGSVCVPCDAVYLNGADADCIYYKFANSGEFIGGNMLVSDQLLTYGGGLRVKHIAIENFGNRSVTSYEYSNGITSYEPHNLANPHLLLDGNYNSWISDKQGKAIDDYRRELNKDFGKLLTVSRELPAPGVVYEYVTVKDSFEDPQGKRSLPNSTQYQFETFSENNVGIIPRSESNSDVAPKSYDGITYEWIRQKDIIVNDLTAQVGKLKRITLFDKDKNKISETINHYLHDNIQGTSFTERVEDYRAKLDNYHHQGVIQETLIDARFTRQKNNTYDLLGIVSRKHYYPAIAVGQTSINYKTGIVTESNTIGFDFYSGQVTRSQFKDGYGNTFVTEITPAFRKYPAMGLAASGGRNMLTQEAASYAYKIGSDKNPIAALASASIQTWSDQIKVLDETVQPGIWRKHANYSFIGDSDIILNGDGLYPLTSGLPGFNAWNKNDPTPDQWQKNGAITLYDVHSHALEASDVNESYAATKMSLENTRVFASVTNAAYDQFAYSGAEENSVNGFYGGGVHRGDGRGIQKESETDLFNTHTGNRALALASANQKTFMYAFNTKAGKGYHASVWVNSLSGRLYYKKDNITKVAPAPTEAVKAGAWYLILIDIPASATSTSVEIWCGVDGGSSVFDDFRVHPVDAVMNAYVYNQWGELSHILDNNNLFTEFKYDGMGRLKETYKETFSHGSKKVSEYKYQYALGN